MRKLKYHIAAIVYLQYFERKGNDFTMIAINKTEKDAISARFPNVHIVRTMKQNSKRHHYYCEESKQVLRLLSEMRVADGTTVQKVGADVGYRKKTK